jgi:hypothetical protein
LFFFFYLTALRPFTTGGRVFTHEREKKKKKKAKKKKRGGVEV